MRKNFFVDLTYSFIGSIALCVIKSISRISLNYSGKRNRRVKRVVIYAYTGIGNYILLTPAIKLLRKQHGEIHITLRYGSGTFCEEMTINSDLIDEYIEIKKESSIFYNAFFALKYRNSFDFLISDFHNKGVPLALEIALLNVPVRVGHVTGGGWSSKFDFLYNHPVSVIEGRHETDMYLDLICSLNNLNPASIPPSMKKTSIYLNKDIPIEVKEIMNGDKINIGFQVGTSSSQRWKQWPLEKYSKLISLLPNNCNVLMLGSKSEKEMINQVIFSSNRENIFNLAGRLSLQETCSVISQLDLIVTNDSGLMHVANSLEVPLIAIYGPTDYSRTAPLAKYSKVVKLDYPCMPCFKMAGSSDVENCPYGYKCLKDISEQYVLDEVKNSLSTGNIKFNKV